ncbi:hypothetical protein [Allosphingosinicella deserti]|uniref:Uncharacterized protein n=1 Tax=Allosphingosinicella deserti TaxID=2116704 RepID=A0A2P7QVZ3_9SPHN|nr:hypothetical protein [Sphingomonas deserti]PSJ42137.1 hypothetical protein C7I55_07845 [Sphingomonas deserti]
MSQSHEGLTPADLGKVVSLVILEVVAAISPTPAIADEKLETIANRLISASEQMVSGGSKEALRCVAEMLIQSDAGNRYEHP